MKRTVSNMLLMLAAAAGVILMAYPHVSNWLATRKQSFIIQEYDNTLQQMETERIQEEWNRAAAYNQNRMVSGSEYDSLLNVNGNGVMGHIKIPKIQINLTIYHGTAESVLNTGIGHLKGTSLPVGGEGSHCALTGHTGLNYSRMFSDLQELEIGDEFYLYILDQALAYQVEQIRIVEPKEIEQLTPEEGKDYVTLITCTPYGINSHRLLVRGVRVDYTRQELESRVKTTQSVPGFETILIVAVSLVLILFLTIVIWRRKRNV